MKPKRTVQKPWPRIVGALALGISAVMIADTAQARQNVCASRDKVVEALHEVYAENPVSLGVTEEGAVIEVMASNEGSFTIVVTHPNGLTCPVASGSAWQSVAEQFKGDGI